MSADAERTIAALDATLRSWEREAEREAGPWIEKLARQQRVFSREVLAAGIARGIAPWSADAMRTLRARQLDSEHRAPEQVAVWLAGSIPTASFLALLLPLLAGSRVYAKPASADPHGPELFAESLRQIDPEVGARLSLGDDASVLGRADAVVSYGSNAAVAAVRELAGKRAVFVGYGHKLSLAWISARADLARAAEGLALDIALWDGRGCLSPGWALVQDDGSGARLNAFADALEGALARLEKELPRGPLLATEELGLRDLRARVAARGEASLRMSHESTAWTIVVNPADTRCTPGSLRAIPLLPVTDLDAALSWCAPLGKQLSCMGQAGEDIESLESVAARVGISRVCALGQMQLPNLDWRHDDMEPMRPFLLPA